MSTDSSGKAAIDRLLTEYRRMCPKADAQLRITQEHKCDKSALGGDKWHWDTRVEVLIGDAMVCDGVGKTAEDAAEDALETLRKAGVAF